MDCKNRTIDLIQWSEPRVFPILQNDKDVFGIFILQRLALALQSYRIESPRLLYPAYLQHNNAVSSFWAQTREAMGKGHELQ